MAKRVCTSLMAIGRGISPEGVPTADTMGRARVTGDYYEAFRSKVGLIVCSGAYSKSMPKPPPEGKTEALSMADYLVRERRVPHGIICVDDESQDTFWNMINSAEYFEDVQVDREHPMGLVAGIAHGVRGRLIASRALDVPRGAVRLINSPGEFNLKSAAVELGGYAMTALALRGVEPGNMDEMIDAAHGFEHMMGCARNVPLLSGIHEADMGIEQS